ncbi:Ribosomal RNA small subunit methyltransferase D [Crenothrix polyspora]|uniref:Ribosomal RNA small subunit methyltransferase D n=1 Tax=Crenothrix polyspora TaxID=360316 RepID=A0A1R4H5P1_9GAMM|nr:16S rRNA (guanine(966)-N(2))-methyltransferase RsmD [Crenothrix polyspora]SJM91588.1 Ribosomal RNA small subunit methyltransferase D [Crenothrix polyspora]
MQNKLRIIGGQWRSRTITFADAPGLRPTPGRVRETLFNWLQYDIAGRTCLDLYAGSGALGFEAASRGAKSVVQVESNPQACQSLKQNVVALSAHQVTPVQAEVQQFLAGEPDCFDVVFIDPPFAKNRVLATCQALENNGWLARHAKIYVETERSLTLEGLPANWRQLKHKVAGEVAYHLFERS